MKSYFESSRPIEVAKRVSQNEDLEVKGSKVKGHDGGCQDEEEPKVKGHEGASQDEDLKVKSSKVKGHDGDCQEEEPKVKEHERASLNEDLKVKGSKVIGHDGGCQDEEEPEAEKQTAEYSHQEGDSSTSAGLLNYFIDLRVYNFFSSDFYGITDNCFMINWSKSFRHFYSHPLEKFPGFVSNHYLIVIRLV